MKPQDDLSLAWVTGGMNGLSYMDSSVVFVYIGCTEHRPPVHCNATPLEVPGLGPWEMCHNTSNDHTLPSSFSVAGNVHAPPITRQTPRPQHASLVERERGCPAINTAHHACTPLRYARTCECGECPPSPVSHSDHTLHSTPSHRPVRRAVTCTRRCRCNSDTQHSRGACPGSLGRGQHCGRGSRGERSVGVAHSPADMRDARGLMGSHA